MQTCGYVSISLVPVIVTLTIALIPAAPGNTHGHPHRVFREHP